jgi:hypothetical protein
MFDLLCAAVEELSLDRRGTPPNRGLAGWS